MRNYIYYQNNMPTGLAFHQTTPLIVQVAKSVILCCKCRLYHLCIFPTDFFLPIYFMLHIFMN